jgi:L-2-hydroxyglutarate oxidase LhgO
MSPSLSVVANNDLNTQRPATVAERVRKLQAEAKQLAKDHIHALMAAITDAERMAAEVAEGGDAYPAGVRDLARRFAEDAGTRVQTLEAITART